MKVIKAKRIVKMAERLHEIQRKKAQLNAELRRLNEDERFYAKLLKTQAGTSFQFNGDEYVKKVEFGSFSRQIMNQAKVRQMLGSKTPYRTSQVQTVNVDYVYE